MSTPHRICPAADLPVGQRKIVDIGKRSIGVFNIKGTYHAISNVCPHQLAPLCLGRVSGTTLPSKPNEFNYGLEGQIIRCPWHGWEFDITTGKSVFNPHKVRVKSYEVTVERDGQTHCCTVDAEAEDPSVQTFPVTVEDQWVVLHV